MGLFNFKKGKREFIDATQAYQRATYYKQYTREELKEHMIEDLQKRIVADSRTYKTYVNVTTYSDYREKLVLPEVAEYFRGKNYKVDLHNDQDYSEVNVLIINWQGQEHFKENRD